MKLLAKGSTICLLLGLVTAGIEDDYKKEGVIPDVLDKAPKSILQISYGNKRVQYGIELTPTKVKDAPKVTWNLDPSNFYTLIMNDPDAPSRQNPLMREYLHWVIGNIPGNNFDKGEILVDYLGAGPPKDTGLHRYILTVYQQPGKIAFDENPKSYATLDSRRNFSLRKFAAKYNLGDPMIGNMFQAQYDDYVPLLYEKFSK